MPGHSPVSLGDHESQGGPNALGGFDSQRAYALLLLAQSLPDADFTAVMVEGAEDVEIRFDRDGVIERRAIQTKGYRITANDARKIIAHFGKLDQASPGTWHFFTIACQGLDTALQRIQTLLQDYRKPQPFYEDADGILANTRAQLVERLEAAGLDAEFAIGRVAFEPDLPDMAHLEAWVQPRVLDALQEAFPALDRAAASDAYRRLLTLIVSKTREPVTRQQALAELEAVRPGLEMAALSPEGQCQQEAAYLDRVREDARYLDREEISGVQAELTDVFVMLQAIKSVPRRMLADVAPLKQRSTEMGLREDSDHSGSEPPPPPVPLQRALAEHRHLVILGEPGTGKTTSLQYLALCFASPGWAQDHLELQEDRLPIRVPLSAYSGGDRLDNFVLDQLHQAYVDSFLARRWLNDGRLLVLLDALDEVPEVQRGRVAQAIRWFAAGPGKCCRIVVTSRIAGYLGQNDLGESFGHFTICPFEPQHIFQYVQSWFRVLKPAATMAEAQAFLDQLEERHGLRRIRGNPLLLRLAVALYAQTGSMPAANRSTLYRRYVEDVAWRRAADKGISPCSQQQSLQALEVIAWELQTKGLQTRAAIARTITAEIPGLADSEKLLKYLCERLGLLTALPGTTEPQIAFRHATFGEYFVARRLAGAAPDHVWSFLRPRLHHPDWREPILLYAGALDERHATQFVKRVFHAVSYYEPVLHRDVLLAADLLGDGVAAAGNWPVRIAQALCRLFSDLEGKKPRFRRTVNDWYGSLRPEIPARLIALPLAKRDQVVAHLVQALTDYDLDARWSAAEALAELGDARAAVQLCFALANPNNHRPHLTIEALRKLGDAAVEPISRALRSQDNGVRRDAARALGELGSPRAYEALVTALAEDRSWVRGSLAEALGRIGDARAVDALIQALGDKDGKVAANAAMALGKLGGERAWNALVTKLTDEDAGVRAAAAEALGPMAGPGFAELLIEDLGADDAVLRKWACQILGNLRDKRAVEPLLGVLDDDDWTVRWCAAHALGKLGDARAVEPLVVAMRDENPDVSYQAAQSLAALRDMRAAEGFVRALADGDAGQRCNAARALGELGDASAIEPLARALSDPDIDVRERAARALGDIGSPLAVEPLLGALFDADVDVYPKPWGPTAVFSDEKFGIRQRAAEALGKIGDARAVEPLLRALTEGRGGVRAAAARALGQIGDLRAIAPLTRALADMDPGGGAGPEAAQALGLLAAKLNDSRALANVIGPLHWWYLIRAKMNDHWAADNASEALMLAVARLTAWAVEQLGDQPSPFRPDPANKRRSLAFSLSVGALLAVLFGFASNFLAVQWQERYHLITAPWRFALVAAVFVLTFGAATWLAWRQRNHH